MSALYHPLAQSSVLGGVMLDNSRFPDVAELLTAEDFHGRDDQAIWNIFVLLDVDSKPLDYLTVTAQLKKTTGHDRLAYVAELIQNTPTAGNIVHYAEIVRDYSIRRQMVAEGSLMIEQAKKYKDGHEILDRAETRLLAIGEARSGSSLKQLNQLLPAFVDGIETRFAHDGSIVGLPTGYDDFDHMTSGLQGADLVIVAGRPSMGKTAFALNISEHVAINQQRPVAVFSLEMPSEQLVWRIAASNGVIPLSLIRNGKLEDHHWPLLTSFIGRANQAPLYIDDAPAMSVMDIRARARRLHRQAPLAMIVVDYLQLMGNQTSDNRVGELGNITRGLKSLAKELSVPVVVLSQLNRSLEQRRDKRPMLSDLRESGAIEQDADLIVFIYRDEVYDKDSNYKGIAEIIIGKQRQGPVGTCYLDFQGHLARFSNRTGDLPGEEETGFTGGYHGG